MSNSNHRIEELLEEEDKNTPRCHEAIRVRDKALLSQDSFIGEEISINDSGVYIPPQNRNMGSEDIYFALSNTDN